jgi:site-specific DNA-cytosine methylase
MADLGYSLGWRVLDAQHFGVPQRRRRVFVVGRRSTDRGVAEILFKSEGLRGYSPTSQQEGQDPTRETPSSFGQTGFAKYTPGVTTLTATTYKRPEDNVVVYKDPIGTLKARDYKGVNHEGARDGHIVVTSSSFGGYTEGVGTLRANGGDLGGGSENLVVHKE